MTIQKFIHTSPRKLRLVADMVRGMKPDGAWDILAVTPKAAAKDLAKAIKTALANARQHGASLDQIVFKKIEINEGMRLRRLRAGTRGRGKPYKRRMSHIKIVLSDDLNIKDQKLNIKNTNQNVKMKIDAKAEENKTEEGKEAKVKGKQK